MHKRSVITEAIKLQNAEYIQIFKPSDLKFCPMIGGPSNETQRRSPLLDLILKPICPEFPSFVDTEDNIDFIHHLPKTTEKGTKLVAFYVTSLHTNIMLHDLGDKAVRDWLDKYRDNVNSRLKDEFIIKGFEGRIWDLIVSVPDHCLSFYF